MADFSTIPFPKYCIAFISENLHCRHKPVYLSCFLMENDKFSKIVQKSQ